MEQPGIARETKHAPTYGIAHGTRTTQHARTIN